MFAIARGADARSRTLAIVPVHMTRLAQIVATLALCLWLGGLIALFTFVSALFKHDRTIAVQAAPVLFDAFTVVQLFVAPIGLIALLAWRTVVRSRRVSALIVLFGLCLASAAYVTLAIIPEMTSIRQAGQSGDSSRFKQLHGRSMIFYGSQTIALLIAAIMWPGAIAQRADGSGPAKGSPDATADRGSVR
jgi:hypothetical protein